MASSSVGLLMPGPGRLGQPRLMSLFVTSPLALVLPHPPPTRIDCLNVVPTVLMEQVDSKVQMVEAATQALKPEHFNHAQWGGVLDAAYGFLRKTIRKDADAAADSLLLLALNKRVSRLEDAVVASSGVALASGGATTNTCSTTNNDSCAGSTHTHDRLPDVHRPDRCATIYDSFQPAALNPIQVSF